MNPFANSFVVTSASRRKVIREDQTFFSYLF